MESNDKTVLVNFNKQEEETSQLDELYMRLGQAYYEGGFEDPLPELLPFFDQITRIRNQKQKKPENPGCPGCGMPTESDAVFCGNCGYRLK